MHKALKHLPWFPLTLISLTLSALQLFLLLRSTHFAEQTPISLTLSILILPGLNLLLLFPTTLLASLLAKKIHPRLLPLTIAATTSILLLDAWLIYSYGYHLRDLLPYLFQPNAIKVAGGLLSWLLQGTIITLIALTITTLAWRVSPPKKWHLYPPATCLALLIFITLYQATDALPSLTRHHLERSYAIQTIDFRHLYTNPKQNNILRHLATDPHLLALNNHFSKAFATAYPAYHNQPTPLPKIPHLTLPQNPPDIVLILVEGFRADIIHPQTTPNLHALAQKGLHLRTHLAASNYSELSTFSLFYGQNALQYQATITTSPNPPLTKFLRQNSYETLMVSAHPANWLGKEKFLNHQSFDQIHFHNDQDTPGPTRDLAVLATSTDLLKEPQRPPRFLFINLIASHAPYSYPKSWAKLDTTTTHKKASLPFAHSRFAARYLRSFAFLDDAIGSFITQTKTTSPNTLLIITGDHGESLGDDGFRSHGTALSRAQLHVPMILIGPNIQPNTINAITTHADLVPSLIHYLDPTTNITSLGTSFFNPISPNRIPVLVTNDARSPNTLLWNPHGPNLALQLHRNHPKPLIYGLLDKNGHRILTPCSEGSRTLWQNHLQNHLITPLSEK